MFITKRLLQSKGACAGQVNTFGKLFPKGVKLTKALCVKHASLFNFVWAEYKKINSVARAEYDKINGIAWAEYVKAIAIAF